MNEEIRSYTVRVRGLVQGVGFRPFIYRMAHRNHLTGWVENRNDGVIIRIEGALPRFEDFIRDLEAEAPPASRILSIDRQENEPEGFSGFRIIRSSDISEEVTEVSPDIAVCPECLDDLLHQSHRIGYPFINCTNCGPRFTIIRDLPYDRAKTTMAPFRMCEQCAGEYGEILDRRFHAQPVACNACGPEYRLTCNGREYRQVNDILVVVASLICEGKLVAIKGLGGFFMACDARNEQAVRRLREAKDRDGKPFAVMFSGIEAAKKFALMDPEEETELASWRRPIVLLRARKHLAEDVSTGFNTIGAMLPYMPIHYMLFEHIKIPAIVLTSGNISEQPILTGNSEAGEKLKGRVDAILDYNRDIYNRTDDSVVMVVNGSVRQIRRSRGFVPSPIYLDLDVDGILAAGAELMNCFCLGKGNQAIMSQHIGDLKNLETYQFFEESVARFRQLFRIQPGMVACDMHPDYLSTRYANESGLPVIRVQHHHAHIASCMAEHGLDEKVIGVSFDGTGYGSDHHIWGGEFLLCDLAGYERPFHFAYLPMPGGDKATEEPWRMAVSYLYSCYGRQFMELKLPFLRRIRSTDIYMIIQAIEKNINAPMTSSAGRLFDAVAAMVDLCTFSRFHAEAPMRLESAIDPAATGEYGYTLSESISFRETIRGVVEDLQAAVPVPVIATRFHNTIISVIFATVSKLSGDTGIRKVILAGGTFQNRYILERIERKLEKSGLLVYTPRQVPGNDGGIALGQLAVASKLRSLSCA